MKALRRIGLIMVIVVVATVLSGCRRTDYAENQAYAIMLGIDYNDGKIELTAKYPKLAGSSGGASGGGSGEESAYSTSVGKGEHFQQALENLKTTVPRQINLSALTMVIVAEDVINAGKFQSVTEGLAANYRMYSAAYIAICEGKAGELIEKQEPQIGSRLSEGLKALIENSEELGTISDSRVADVHYGYNSVYSDPLVMSCMLTDEKSGTEYAGSYVLIKDQIAVKFDRRQTVLVNVLRGDVKQFTYTSGENAAFVSVDKAPSIDVELDKGINIKIKLELSAMITDGSAGIEEYAEMIREEMYDVVGACVAEGAEPFGFADRAAGDFVSVEEWNDYDWHEKFKSSNIIIEVKVTEIF